MGDFISPHMIYKYSKPQKNNQKCLKIIFFDSRSIGFFILLNDASQPSIRKYNNKGVNLVYQDLLLCRATQYYNALYSHLCLEADIVGCTTY